MPVTQKVLLRRFIGAYAGGKLGALMSEKFGMDLPDETVNGVIQEAHSIIGIV